jgi:hypothetical protein
MLNLTRSPFSECRYAKCRYDDCRGAKEYSSGHSGYEDIRIFKFCLPYVGITLGATTLIIMTLSITAFSIMALSKKDEYRTISINDTHNDYTQRLVHYYAECHYAECRYTECRGA